MEENIEKISVKDVSVKWGLISGVIGILFYLILILGDLFLTPGVSYIGLIPFAVVLYMAYKEFKDQGDTYMSFGEALKIGFLISLIGGLLLSVFNIIYGQFVDPELANRIKDMMIEQWEAQGMTDEQIDQAMSFTNYMFNPLIGFALVLVKNIIVGFILSLIIGAIAKNNNPELEV